MFVISVHLVLVPDSQWVVLLQPFSMQVLLHRYHDPSLSPSSTNIILRWNEKKLLPFCHSFILAGSQRTVMIAMVTPEKK